MEIGLNGIVQFLGQPVNNIYLDICLDRVQSKIEEIRMYHCSV